MRALTDYPTPETDELVAEFSVASDAMAPVDSFRLLEQKLAACREALASLDTYPDVEIEADHHGGRAFCEISIDDMRLIRETLKLTTQ